MPLLVGCNKESEQEIDSVVEEIIFPSLQNFTASVGDEFTLYFSASDSWNIELDVAWIEFDLFTGRYASVDGVAAQDNQLTFVVTDDYHTQSDDTGQLTMYMGGESAVIATVLRMGKEEESELIDEEIEVDPEEEPSDEETETEEEQTQDQESTEDQQQEEDQVDDTTTEEQEEDQDVQEDESEQSTTVEYSLEFTSESHSALATISQMDSSHEYYQYFADNYSLAQGAIFILEYHGAGISEQINYPFDFNWDTDNIEYGSLSGGLAAWLSLDYSFTNFTVTMNSSTPAEAYILLQQRGITTVAIYCVQTI